jgi:hypothetical protein
MTVFISYSRQDGEDYRNTVIREIEKNGFVAWVDNEKIPPGDVDWWSTIEQAIKSSFAMILIITPRSIESVYVTYEWIYALGMGRLVFPIILSDIDKDTLHPKIKRINYKASKLARTDSGITYSTTKFYFC